MTRQVQVLRIVQLFSFTRRFVTQLYNDGCQSQEAQGHAAAPQKLCSGRIIELRASSQRLGSSSVSSLFQVVNTSNQMLLRQQQGGQRKLSHQPQRNCESASTLIISLVRQKQPITDQHVHHQLPRKLKTKQGVKT